MHMKDRIKICHLQIRHAFTANLQQSFHINKFSLKQDANKYGRQAPQFNEDPVFRLIQKYFPTIIFDSIRSTKYFLEV